jgi:N-acetylmuramoyl-L-alanine amidase
MSASNGVREQDVTIDIARRLQRRLAGAGVDVVMARQGDETIVSGDLLLSIHLNALASRNRRGVETYYLGPSDAPSADVVAAHVNGASGREAAESAALAGANGFDIRQGESRRLARSVQGALVRGLRRVNPLVEDRGVRTAPLVVLAGAKMPAVLAEVSALSSDEEAELLKGDGYRQSIADALFDGINAYVREGALVGRGDSAATN